MAEFFKNSLKIFKLSARNIHHSLRFISSSLVQNVHDYSVIPLWVKSVDNFGYLSVFSTDFGVHLTGSNPRLGENGTIGVSLVSDSKDLSSFQEHLGVIKECIRGNISDKEDGMSQILIEAYGNESLQKIKPNFLDKVKLLIEVPYSYDLYLKSLAQTAVTVEKLECNDIEIHAETDCHLSQLKCRSITVNSNSGDILSDSLIGDLALTTSENGTIRLTKVQGTDVKINSKNGEVNISSLYGGNTLVNTQRGNVVIGDAHGNVEASSSTGDIKCGSISGMLHAVTEQGDIETKLTSGGNVDAVSFIGNATIKLDSNLKYKLDISSKTTNISSDIHVYEESTGIADDLTTITGETKGVGEQYVQVKCHNGIVNIVQESWFVMPET